MPYRGLDSGYKDRWCSSAAQIASSDGKLIGFRPNSQRCDHYSSADLQQIPKMAVNVREAINFLGKDNDGFFMMYEQGDVSWEFVCVLISRLLIGRTKGRKFLMHSF